MRLVKGLLPALALLGLCVAVTPAWGGDAEKPNPHKTLKKLTRNLLKAKSYEIQCEVTGGISTTADHKVSNVSVRESYQADMYRNLMRVPKLNAYRSEKSGAMRSGGVWYSIHSTAEGKKLDRLFAFPTKILVEAVKSPKDIRWLDEPAEEVEEVAEGSGHTGVVRKVKRNSGLPTKLYVEVPDKVAIQHFIEVQNSGCLSGG